MPEATSNHKPSRRGLLSLAGLLPLAALPALPAITAGRLAINDPLLHLHRQYLATQAAEALASDRVVAIRSRVAERWGECRGDRAIQALWSRDPEHPALCAALSECDGLTQQLSDITDLIVETPATTPAGVAAKLLVAIDVFPKPNDNTEYHERVAIAVMMDAVAALPSQGEVV
jgi:hypothetical protein